MSQPPSASDILEEVYNNPNISHLEEKFTLIRKLPTEFVSKYPLEYVMPGWRGVYGGDFLYTAITAAWDTIEAAGFQPHSLHSYFLAAGHDTLPMRYEVDITLQGLNFCLRVVRVYQTETNKLCFHVVISFTKNNNATEKQEAFSKLTEQEKYHPRTKVPVSFARQPNKCFDENWANLEDLLTLEHTNGNLTHAVSREILHLNDEEHAIDVPFREYGAFFKVNDDISLAKDQFRARILTLAFALDTFFLGCLMRAVGMSVIDKEAREFFRVSLDHSIWFHDNEYDPTEWMFMDFRFLRMGNDRVLVTVSVFTTDKVHVATIQQEALSFMPMKLAERANGLHFKL